MRISSGFLLSLAWVPAVIAFAPLNPSVHNRARQVSSRYMSLRPVYDELCQKVGAQFDLKYTDFTSVIGGQSWECPTASGTAEWLDESSPRFLTGVSFLTRENDPAIGLLEELTINVWMGPSYDTPHMLLTFGEAGDGQYYVTADYVPRGPNVLGSDPQYLGMYYGPDVQQAWSDAYPPPGQASDSFPLRPAYEFESRLLDSPCRISVVGMDASKASTLATQHVERFLAWVDQAEPIPARSRGAFNMRDDKLRQYFFRGQYQLQARLLGEELGSVVAAANTGPTAEAYVGGGS